MITRAKDMTTKITEVIALEDQPFTVGLHGDERFCRLIHHLEEQFDSTFINPFYGVFLPVYVSKCLNIVACL